MLRVEGVTKRYGDVVALRGVDLAVDRGEIVVLLGANGAGKSTLFSLVAGLRRPDEGRVAIDVAGGNPRTPAVRAHIGFAPQELGVYPSISVAKNLRLFTEMAGLRGAAATERIESVADDLGLTALLGRAAGALSGGERRRLHVGMALVHEPGLVVLDEPTAGVDVSARADFVTLVQRVAQRGAAVVYSTHYLAEAEAFGGRVAVMHRGRKVADAPLAALIEDLDGRVELTFEGPVPDVRFGGSARAEISGSVVTFVTSDPEHEAALILANSPDFLSQLRSIRVLPASLEDAYRAITGEALVEEAS